MASVSRDELKALLIDRYRGQMITVSSMVEMMFAVLDNHETPNETVMYRVLDGLLKNRDTGTP